MTPAEADWIAATALTPRYLASCGGIELVRLCSCQFGACGWCAQLGQHDRCQRGPVVGVHTRLVARDGAALTQIWTSGTPCAWRCPCDCPTPEPVPLALPADAPTQLALFEVRR